MQQSVRTALIFLAVHWPDEAASPVINSSDKEEGNGYLRQFVRQKNPCADGFRWFMRHFQEGADYQPLLDALVAAGRVSGCLLADGSVRADQGGA